MIETERLGPALQDEIEDLGRQLLGDDARRLARFSRQLLDMYLKARDQDVLLVHNSGGWGNAGIDHCLDWEVSVVEGIASTMKGLGYNLVTIQYQRSGDGWREKVHDAREQMRFFTVKAKLMAAGLSFLTRHISGLRVVMVGVSQGAAFTNAVIQQLPGSERFYSIELGMPFAYRSRRSTTDRVLALDSNGVEPDAMVERDIIGGFRAYVIGPIQWFWYRLLRRPVRFARCINAPGHDYGWKYPEVRRQVQDFLAARLGGNGKSEVVEG